MTQRFLLARWRSLALNTLARTGLLKTRTWPPSKRTTAELRSASTLARRETGVRSRGEVAAADDAVVTDKRGKDASYDIGNIALAATTEDTGLAKQ